jgi:hypothetical protein
MAYVVSTSTVTLRRVEVALAASMLPYGVGMSQGPFRGDAYPP